MIRLTFMLRRNPAMSREEFQAYWRNEHGPLVASFASRLNIVRYVQVHTFGDSAARADGPRGPMEEPYDGVAELWWWDREALAAATATDAGRAAGRALLEDEGRFIDLPRSPLWLNHEYPQVNPVPETVAREKSGIVKLFYALRPAKAMDEEAAKLYWRTNHGPIIRSHAEALRIMRYVQVHRVADEVESALRAGRGTVVDSYMGHAELWYDRGVQVAPTVEGSRASRAAVEDEAKFIDFSRSVMFFGKEHVIIDRR